MATSTDQDRQEFRIFQPRNRVSWSRFNVDNGYAGFTARNYGIGEGNLSVTMYEGYRTSKGRGVNREVMMEWTAEEAKAFRDRLNELYPTGDAAKVAKLTDVLEDIAARWDREDTEDNPGLALDIAEALGNKTWAREIRREYANVLRENASA